MDAEVLFLESSDQAPLDARRFTAAVFGRWGVSDDYLARLVVSELVTNAYLHGSGAIILRLSPAGEGGVPLVEVYDESDRLPTVRPENYAAEDGRGLATIA
ncbi:ATP-binding protein, partial [Actinomadura adrarensis]